MEAENSNNIREHVRKSYAQVALNGGGCGTGGSSCCGPSTAPNPENISVGLGYSENDVTTVPEGANMGLGCGNPQAIAELKPGETVLDLGSGGGFDSLLASRAVGDSGKVIGVDMTPEMINKARKSLEKVSASNVEFRLGEIEALPVANDSVDVIISNCVINLSPEKSKVFKESFRILKSGGRLAIADVVATAPLPEKVKKDLDLHAGCVAGASSIEELETLLKNAGFVDVSIEPIDRSREIIKEWSQGKNIEDYLVSANIRGVKA